ncbi:syntaxin binding protein 6 (amisyn), like [Echeneis naucrates]|uniref:syntaxin binding protein 6 (amisyn), like n=1 Tax=Echeneis naucrates TaxID=173247 RepID=UPI0011144488|nr:syntaxin-binding protein 6-like [Echeneis naucrates]
MNVHSTINKEVFVPHDERMLVAVEVWRRKRKRMSFLPAGPKGNYATFICLSVTNTRPHQLLITKVKKFGGVSSFTRRSQWTVEQLRQVNGINPNKDSPEFDLIFDNTVDQWVASSSAEKCIFVQILYHACQTYSEGKTGTLGKVGKLGWKNPQGRVSLGAHRETEVGLNDSSPGFASKTLLVRRKSYVLPKQTEFINCQSKLTGDASTVNLVIYRCKAFLNRIKNVMVAKQRRTPGQLERHFTSSTMAKVVQKMNMALGERGERLTRAEDKTIELMHTAQQFADTAHKLALKYSK